MPEFLSKLTLAGFVLSSRSTTGKCDIKELFASEKH